MTTNPDELAASLRDLLPHDRFQIRARVIDGTPVLHVECHCRRALPWLGGLHSDILARWLADHDDDAFLTEEQLLRKHNATIQLPDLVVAVDDCMPPGVIALAAPGHIVAYNMNTGGMAEMRQDQRGDWVGARIQP